MTEERERVRQKIVLLCHTETRCLRGRMTKQRQEGKQCSDFMRAKATVCEASKRRTCLTDQTNEHPREPEFESYHFFSVASLDRNKHAIQSHSRERISPFVAEASHPPSELRLAPEASTQQISKPEDCFSEGGPRAESFVQCPSDRPSVTSAYLPALVSSTAFPLQWDQRSLPFPLHFSACCVVVRALQSFSFVKEPLQRTEQRQEALQTDASEECLSVEVKLGRKDRRC